MEKYRLIADIKYKENRFKVLSNAQCQKYFLKVLDDESLIYPTLEEFKELYKIFNKNPYNLSYMINENKCKLKNNMKMGKRYSIIPKVIYRGTLISLATALMLLGYSKSIGANYNLSKIELLEKQNIYVEELNNDILMFKNGDNVIFCENVNEFKKYVNVKSPTFEDVRKALENNGNITGRYKEWINNGIDNLEASGINMDLTVLYYNISRINIIEQSVEEIKGERQNSNTKALFNSESATVRINKENTNEFELCHEVLGHGMTQVSIDNKVYRWMEIPILQFNDEEEKKYVYNVNQMGEGLTEGIADIIACIAINENFQTEYSPYDAEVEQLQILKESLNMSWEDIIDNGVYGIYNEMIKNDFKSPLEYIENIDIHCAEKRDNELNINTISVKDNIKNFLMELAKNKIENGENKEDVINFISNIFDKIKFEYIEEVIPADGYENAIENIPIQVLHDSNSTENLKNEIIKEIESMQVNQLEEDIEIGE